MKISNFTLEELQQFYNNNEIIFISYRSIYMLNYSKNSSYFFSLITQGTLPKTALPYTKRGKFHALTPDNNLVKTFLPTYIFK